MLPPKCIAWRVEHRRTRMGPIAGAWSSGVWNAIDTSTNSMSDITDDVEIRNIVLKNDARFGFTRLSAIERMVLDTKILREFGYILSKYEVVPLYIHELDTQVIFSEMQLLKEYNF